jgi:hypothetical protein
MEAPDVADVSVTLTEPEKLPPAGLNCGVAALPPPLPAAPRTTETTADS